MSLRILGRIDQSCGEVSSLKTVENPEDEEYEFVKTVHS